MPKIFGNFYVLQAIFWAILSLFIIKGALSLDPDFGYRLRNGELILSGGIPKMDLYSYTMPSFPAVEHAWVTAVGFATIHKAAGKIGLAVISSAFVLLALIISASRVKIRTLPKIFEGKNAGFVKFLIYFTSFPFLLAVGVILPFSGVRAQVVTWLLLAILLRVVLDVKLWQKWRIITPFYFILWANLHGGFASGLAVLALVIILRTARQRKITWTDMAVVVSSFAVTLINPYGTAIWREVWSSISDTQLRLKIVEWMPAIFMADISMVAFLTFSFALILRYRKKFPLEELGLYLTFMLQALSSRRHLPLWVLVALPMTILSIEFFYKEIRGITKAIPRFKKTYKVAWLGSLVILALSSVLAIRGALYLSEDAFYPKSAISYLRSNLPTGEVFSEYGWGGYLIWKLPEKKVFIDGRMPSWRWDKNPPNEEAAVFDTYSDLLNGEVDFRDVFEKYNVEVVLWPRPRPESLFDVLQKRLDEFLVKLGKEKKDFYFLDELEKDGWERVYQDSVAEIYKQGL